jgi:hypothetical protein
MIALVRLVVVVFVVLTVFYFLISIYARSLRRERLEKRWEEEGRTGSREAYVRAGMAAYDASLRPRLILGVYIIPTAVIAVVFYIINFHG